MNELTDAAVVEAFVAHIAEQRNQGIQVDSRPDIDNRNAADIDAIAGPLAIEHTSIDTLANQRRDGSWFGGVAQPLEDEFRERLPFRLRLIFPYEAIRTGQDWAVIRERLREWVAHGASALTDGRHSIRIPDVPFDVSITKESDRAPGLFCGRVAPPDDNLSERLAILLNRKAAKLKPYRDAGKTTVLLVESGDMALMNVLQIG
jgi:hypothetical protein